MVAAELFASDPKTTGGGEYRAALDVAETQLWSAFAAPKDQSQFHAAWLGLQCGMIRGCRSGALLLADDANQGLQPAAIWPDAGRTISYFKDVVEQTLAKKSGVLLRLEPGQKESSGAGGDIHVAYPLELEDRVCGAVVIEVGDKPDREIQAILRQLHWGIGWLAAGLWREESSQNSAGLRHAVFAMELLAVMEEHQKPEAAAMAIVNEMAARLSCERVALGINSSRMGGGRIRVRALSHSSWFRRKSTLVLGLESAMEEALDQNSLVAMPEVEGVERRITVAHSDYRKISEAAGVASIILPSKGTPIGVITLERHTEVPFDRETLHFAEVAGALVGPVLDLKFRTRKWVSGRLIDAICGAVRATIGPRRPSLKIAAILAVLVIVLAALHTKKFNISGDAVLEGASQLAIVAPFDGYILSDFRRAGEVVRSGELLATMEDKDLKLDLLRWQSEFANLTHQQRQSLGDKDRVKFLQLAAQIERAKAQMQLTQLQLGRTKLTSPVGGLIISGDLSQKRGSPIRKGDELFVVAPLSNYRVILHIGESDIRYLQAGQTGHLLLAGRADSALPIRVTSITALASVNDGQNVFRVEAQLDKVSDGIRPGMEGIAKVEIGERRTLWIWTRSLIDWGRMVFWRWVP